MQANNKHHKHPNGKMAGTKGTNGPITWMRRDQSRGLVKVTGQLIRSDESGSVTRRNLTQGDETMGCNECGLVYSLVFGIQYHKVDCTVGMFIGSLSARERRLDAEQTRARIAKKGS